MSSRQCIRCYEYSKNLDSGMCDNCWLEIENEEFDEQYEHSEERKLSADELEEFNREYRRLNSSGGA